jgi:CRISPR/Cas system-associated exonuclease Cas4 (RecB family)
MAELPERQHSTATRVEQWRGSQPQEHRAHLGASVLGHDCSRNLWYLFRNALLPTFSGKLLRVFLRGKNEEAVVFDELRAIGVELHTEMDGKQIDCRDESGHIGGSVDGIGKGFPEAPNTWAVLEIKTHAAKSFNDMVKHKVQASKPQHFAQMQVYMGLLGIDRALYFAVNKDNDDLYTEWVHFDPAAFDGLIKRGRSIIDLTEPPQRLSEDANHWQCRYCQHHALCHQKRVAETNCRTCVHSTPGERGTWHCARHDKVLSRDEEMSACEQHLLIPALIPYATPVDGNDNYVEYTHDATGKTFRNGVGGLSSREISACTESVIVDPTIEAMRATFGATVKSSRPRKPRTAELAKTLSPPEDNFNDEIPF